MKRLKDLKNNMSSRIPLAAVAKAYVSSLPKEGDGLHELSTVFEAFQSIPALRAHIADTSISVVDRKKALTLACQGIGDETIGCLLLLARLKMMKQLDRFLIAVEKAYAETGVVYADISSSVELSDAQKKRMHDTLVKKTKGDIRLHVEKDATLLGGIILRLGDWRFDASVKGRIERLRRHFLSNLKNLTQ
jgi:F-type H+-transporting ATPase subunit delta